MDIFLARQAVYNKKRNVEYYELLYRNSDTNRFDPNVSSKNATYEVINNISCIGFEVLTINKKGLINCDEEVLMCDAITVLSNSDIIIEILESVIPTIDIIYRIKQLKELGYEIALDDVVDFDYIEKYLPYVKYVKVDFLLTNSKQRYELLQKLKQYKVLLLAEKVESEEEFKEAVSLGCHYFQGYYFSKPNIVKGKDITIKTNIVVDLIKEIANDNFNIEKVENIMKSDVALMYKFMKFINSSFFNFLQEISSIRQAVMLVGQEQLKKWLSIISFVDLNKGNNKEYTNLTIMRARLCELIISEMNKEAGSDGFLVGMFSDLDLLVGDDISKVLSELPVKVEIKKALSGEDNILKKSLDLTLSYERMDLDSIEKLSKEIGINKERLSVLYLTALKWVQQIEMN